MGRVGLVTRSRPQGPKVTGSKLGSDEEPPCNWALGKRGRIRGLTPQIDQRPHSPTKRTDHFDTRRFKRNIKVAAMFVVFGADL
ncbi:hypothetical protein AVEN_132459-1 [Araneus ventricosus]|uniref:Uncharacterized protein n=1 Tax=Araneus ventricosus TaxID=182803 RepID=A0A4Y2UZI1_ARAVE|nr:hypothetical protein AVEN_13023-1 [Araneus ventricosus]GBO18352.1 hypothetical protein AVEN_27750-1 [Araneus ventricosus]GBO18389.1 hypothetical protein AVEN_245884-1 [Araneus ventricosus]GBO18399.1 hypothetical protein AVEN_132459-1 [Araneus ventricosus]